MIRLMLLAALLAPVLVPAAWAQGAGVGPYSGATITDTSPSPVGSGTVRTGSGAADADHGARDRK